MRKSKASYKVQTELVDFMLKEHQELQVCSILNQLQDLITIPSKVMNQATQLVLIQRLELSTSFSQTS